MTKPKDILEHARHDHTHCLAPGLFRSLKKGERKKSLDITYKQGNRSIRIVNFELLGVDDLRVLQGLVVLAGPDYLILSPDPKTDLGRELRVRMDFQWDAIDKKAIVVKSSYRALAREIGYKNIEESKGLRECVERLWATSLIVQNGKERMGFRLLSQYSSKDGENGDGELFVALNPLIAQAIMGSRHARIIMEEVRRLESDPARLIYQRLCGWVDPSKTGAVTIETLTEYVWPDVATPSTVRKRHQRVRGALAELVAIGWVVAEYAKGKFRIGRPSL